MTRKDGISFTPQSIPDVSVSIITASNKILPDLEKATEVIGDIISGEA